MRRTAIFVLLLTAGCGGEGMDRASTAEQLLAVSGAQWFAGSPQVVEDGPEVKTLDSKNNSIYPGIRNKQISGRLGPGSVAVGVGVEGDKGYWVLPAGPADGEEPDCQTFDARLSFSATLPPGPRRLFFWAIDSRAAGGQAYALSLDVTDPVPDGALVVSLAWDTNADLDLRVTQPDGKEIGSEAASVLDFDSNAACAIDGRNRENAVWDTAPLPGTYTVRVDTFSLCSESTAHWRVRVLHGGQEIGAAQGQSLPSDTGFQHGLGAGIQALQFQVP